MARRAALFALAASLLALGLLVVPYANSVARSKQRAARVRALLHVGMHDDQAVRVLTAAGYEVGPSIAPTANSNYFQRIVPLSIHKHPLDTAYYVVTGGGHPFQPTSHVVIETDGSGIITAIR